MVSVQKRWKHNSNICPTLPHFSSQYTLSIKVGHLMSSKQHHTDTSKSPVLSGRFSHSDWCAEDCGCSSMDSQPLYIKTKKYQKALKLPFKGGPKSIPVYIDLYFNIPTFIPEINICTDLVSITKIYSHGKCTRLMDNIENIIYWTQRHPLHINTAASKRTF